MWCERMPLNADGKIDRNELATSLGKPSSSN